MQLLIASTKDAAQLLNEKAMAWIQENVAGANMGQWSPLYTDGAAYGIAWEDRLAPAFDPDELFVIDSDEDWHPLEEPAAAG